MNPAIYTESLSKKFGGTTALSDINFVVPEGAIYALVGANYPQWDRTLEQQLIRQFVGLSNSLKSYGGQGRFDQLRYLCPGTPVTFTQYNLVRRTQADLIISNFHLPSPVAGSAAIQLTR